MLVTHNYQNRQLNFKGLLINRGLAQVMCDPFSTHLWGAYTHGVVRRQASIVCRLCQP